MESPQTSPAAAATGVRNLLSREEIRAFHRVSIAAWVRDAVAVWLVILAALLLAVMPFEALACLAGRSGIIDFEARRPMG